MKKVNKILFVETKSEFFNPYQNWYFPLKKLCKQMLDFDIRKNLLLYGKEETNRMFLELVNKEKPEYIFLWAKPDDFYPDTFLEIRRKCPGTRTFIILQDDDNDFEGITRFLLLFIDYGLIFQRKYMQNYLKEGIDRIFYNSGTDPGVFKPVKTGKKYDVVFIGYSKNDKSGRYELVKFLKDNGVNIRIFGWGWGNYSDLKDIYGGALSTEDLLKVMSQSRIVLNFTKNGAGKPHLTAKLFEAAACKAFVLCEYYEEYKTLFEEGKELIMFKNNQELLEKIDYYLKHDSEREKIAEAMHRRMLKEYDIRKQIPTYLKEVEKQKNRKIELPEIKGKISTLTLNDFNLSDEDLIKKVEDSDYLCFNFENLPAIAHKEYLQAYAIEKSGKDISCCDYYLYSKNLGDYITVLTNAARRELDTKGFNSLVFFDQLMMKKSFFKQNLERIRADVSLKHPSFIEEINTTLISFPLVRVKPFKLGNYALMKKCVYLNFLYTLFSLKTRGKLFTSAQPFAIMARIIGGDKFLYDALIDILTDKDKKSKLHKLIK